MTGIRVITAPLAFVDDAWIADAAIAIHGDLIAWAGPASELPERFAGASVEAWGDRAVVPGGVNGHGHTFQALVRGFGDDLRFADWMGGLVHPTAAGLGADGIRIGAEFDFVEMLRMGITTAVEYFYLHDRGNENSRVILDAARSVGMRTVLARCMFDADPGPVRYRESLAEYEANYRELATELADDPLLHVHPAPHSVLGTSAEMLRLGNALAREFDVPLHTHVADSPGEVGVSRSRWDLTPVGRLADVGVLDEYLLAVHAVNVDEHDLALLASSGATVVHNPSANAFLGGGVMPLVRMRELGIPVALGTDAGGANSRQSLFEEMRMSALLAKATAQDASVVTATDVLRLGTSAGGAALRMPVGRIAAGFAADLVSLDLEAPSLKPRRTATQNVVYSMQPEAIDRVLVGGRTVVDDGEVVTVDVPRVLAEVDVLTASWTPLTGTHPAPAASVD
ncbi:amidohydrolase family protein [Agromyces sp. SYSU T00194]|uniref:amidohydrolase family protein n=1 Tax=Agromyces chitinivorans TaxID=3158560 RepID=UPI003392B265